MKRGLKIGKKERARLRTFLDGQTPVRVAKRARILLALAENASISEAAQQAWSGTATVKRIKKRYVEEGLDAALSERPRPGPQMKTTPEERARLVALACSAPPEGHPRWTYQLLWEHWDTAQQVGMHTVRLILIADGIKPWREKNVVRPQDRREIRGADAQPAAAVRPTSRPATAGRLPRRKERRAAGG